jgi:hypothetical protein
MWVIDKATALAGGPLTVTVFPNGFDEDNPSGTFGFALQPAVTFGLEPKLYLVDSTGFTLGGTALLRMSEISGTGAAPTWSPTAGSSIAPGFFPVANDFDFTHIGAEQLGADCQRRVERRRSVPHHGQLHGVCRRIDSGDKGIGSSPASGTGGCRSRTGGRPRGRRYTSVPVRLSPALMASSGDRARSGVVEGVGAPLLPKHRCQ